MKLFLDTADIEEIRIAARWGVLDGVTTNPTLYAKVGGSYEDILKEICKITPGPVSAEVVAEDVEGMLREGREFAKLAPNIVVKVPMSEEGLEAISRFAEEGIKTNCTLIFSANQGLLAAKAGASLLSPFVGRIDDINMDGMDVIRDLVAIVEMHDLDSEVLAASIRHPLHVTQSALAGCAHRDAAVQGAAADGPPPADGQGHHHVPQGLGRRAQGGRGQGKHWRGSRRGRLNGARRGGFPPPQSPTGGDARTSCSAARSEVQPDADAARSLCSTA